MDHIVSQLRAFSSFSPSFATRLKQVTEARQQNSEKNIRDSEKSYRHRVFSFEGCDEPSSDSKCTDVPVPTVRAVSSFDGTQNRQPEGPLLPSLPVLQAVSSTLDDVSSLRLFARSCSSEYPPEGMRSPELTVSPPATFHRRIFGDILGEAGLRPRLTAERLFAESDDTGNQAEEPVVNQAHQCTEERSGQKEGLDSRHNEAMRDGCPELPVDNLESGSARSSLGLPTPSLTPHGEVELRATPGDGETPAKDLLRLFPDNDNGPMADAEELDTSTVRRLRGPTLDCMDNTFDGNVAELLRMSPRSVSAGSDTNISMRCLPRLSTNAEPFFVESQSIVTLARSARSRTSLKSRLSARIGRLNLRQWILRKLVRGKKGFRGKMTKLRRRQGVKRRKVTAARPRVKFMLRERIRSGTQVRKTEGVTAGKEIPKLEEASQCKKR